MDILDRIIEAIAQKLIALKLEENQYSYSEIPDTGDKNAGKKSGSSNPRNKTKVNKGKKNFHQKGFVPPKGTKALTSQEAGASAKSIRTGSNKRLVSKVDQQKARRTPIKPEGQSAGGRGGQEETTSQRATPADRPKGRILSREEAKEKLIQMRKTKRS